MNMRRFLFIFWSLILSTSTFSQVLFEGTVNENLLKGRVKQIEEFIARFNNEEDWEGKKGNICTDTLYRKKYIRTLFDQSYYRKANGELTPLAEKFIHEVVKNNYKIHFTDSTWSAQVDCKAIIGGRQTNIKLYLRTEKVAPFEYIWVISNYETPLLPTTPKAPRPYLSPTEHEIGFIGLLALSDGYKNTTRLFPSQTKTDRLSGLAFLIQNGMFKVKEITNVRFHFHNIPGYAFTIKRIERKNSYNTGWLITNLNSL